MLVFAMVQLSVELLSTAVAVTLAFPLASNCTVTGWVFTVGFTVSPMVTVAVVAFVFPEASLTVKVTVFVPRLEQSKLVLSNEKPVTAQLSVDPFSICEGVIVAVPEASSCMVIS